MNTIHIVSELELVGDIFAYLSYFDNCLNLCSVFWIYLTSQNNNFWPRRKKKFSKIQIIKHWNVKIFRTVEIIPIECGNIILWKKFERIFKISYRALDSPGSISEVSISSAGSSNTPRSEPFEAQIEALFLLACSWVFGSSAKIGTLPWFKQIVDEPRNDQRW